MRLLLPLLLLSTAVPAFAADPADQEAREARDARAEQRQQARQERAAERPQPRFERPAPQFERAERVAPPMASPDRPERRFDGGRPAEADAGPRWRDRRPDQPQAAPPPAPVASEGFTRTPGGRPEWRGRDRDGREGREGRDGVAYGDRRPDQRPVIQPNPAVRIDGATYGWREGRDPNVNRERERDRDRNRWQDRDGRRDGGQWTGRDGRYDRDDGRWRQGGIAYRPDWRRDPRYDWQRYRDRNRSIFRIGVYIDPFGWGYRPVNIGYRLYPNYYSQQYWIGDPSYYSLPPVGWPYQWVRYYNDALLIDVRDGRVVDAIQSFFW